MYVQIGFAVLGGWVIFSHIPDQWTLIGMGLVALCGALGAWLTLRESRVPVELPES
jgi:drug/metabolite transporter (DMT)-like permease